MASINKVILVGNLGAEPETRYTSNGDAVTTIRLATTDSWKDKQSGEKHEATEWHRVVFYRKLAEIAGQYLRKGSQVYIEGRIKTRKWQDKEGQDRYTTEIEASEMQMLGQKQVITATQPVKEVRDDEGRIGSTMPPEWMEFMDKTEQSSKKEAMAKFLQAKNESLEAMAKLPFDPPRERKDDGGIRWAQNKPQKNNSEAI